MHVVTLKIEDSYLEKAMQVLESLPKKFVKMESDGDQLDKILSQYESKYSYSEIKAKMQEYVELHKVGKLTGEPL